MLQHPALSIYSYFRTYIQLFNCTWWLAFAKEIGNASLGTSRQV